MTKEEARARLEALKAEFRSGAVAFAMIDICDFWRMFVANPGEAFPAWPNTEADDEANRAKWHRLSKAYHEAGKRRFEINHEMDKLCRIYGIDY